jgi:hypothetical protein
VPLVYAVPMLLSCFIHEDNRVPVFGTQHPVDFGKAKGEPSHVKASIYKRSVRTRRKTIEFFTVGSLISDLPLPYF